MVKTIRILYYLMLGYMLLVFVLCCIGLMSFGYGLGDGFMLIFLLIVIGLLALFIRPIKKMERLNVAQFIALGLLMFVPCIFLTYKVTYDRGPEHAWDGHILWIRSDPNEETVGGTVNSKDIDRYIEVKGLEGRFFVKIKEHDNDNSYDIRIIREDKFILKESCFEMCQECKDMKVSREYILNHLYYFDNAGRIYLRPIEDKDCYLEICNADS